VMRRRTRTAVLPLLLMLAALLPLRAWGLQAHLEMDARQLRVGETAALRLVVTGGVADAAPVLPEVSQLRFTRQRPRQELVSHNFQTTRITTYNWAVRAVETGVVEIGPLQIAVGGRTLKVSAIELEILEATAADEGPNILVASIDPSPDDLADGAPVPLWQGQTLVYRFSFSHRDTLYGADWTQPDYLGFETAPGVEPDTREYSIQRGGHVYTVHDASVPLRAVGDGVVEIGPSVVKAQFPVERGQRRRSADPFEEFFNRPFGGPMFAETRTEVLASNPVQVELRPLPESGRPSDFSGLVGSFDVQVELEKDRVAVGDSVALTINVRGDGVLAGLELPPAEASEALRVYDDVPEIKAGLVSGGFRSRAVLRRALVPTAEGVISLPPIHLSWFDPAQAAYVEWELPAMELQVDPGEPGAAPVVVDFGAEDSAPREAVATLGEDILPIHTDVQVRDRRFRPLHPLPLLLVLLPGLALVAQIGLDLRRRGGGLGQRKKAVRARLAALPEARAERLAALEAIFREAAGLALGVPPSAVDAARLREGLPEPLSEQAAALYRALEGARYAGMPPGDLESELRALVDQLLGRAR
jgi:hypothetical protein